MGLKMLRRLVDYGEPWLVFKDYSVSSRILLLDTDTGEFLRLTLAELRQRGILDIDGLNITSSYAYSVWYRRGEIYTRPQGSMNLFWSDNMFGIVRGGVKSSVELSCTGLITENVLKWSGVAFVWLAQVRDHSIESTILYTELIGDCIFVRMSVCYVGERGEARAFLYFTSIFDTSLNFKGVFPRKGYVESDGSWHSSDFVSGTYTKPDPVLEAKVSLLCG